MVMVVMGLAAMESVVPDPTSRTSGWGRPPPEQPQKAYVVAIARRIEWSRRNLENRREIALSFSTG